MQPDDADRTRLQATIAALRYWVPSITDTARATETVHQDAWTLDVVPNAPGAAGFRLTIREAGSYDLTVGGEHYADRAITSNDVLPRIAEAIAAGNVFHRHWSSANTGTWRGTETLIVCADGTTWHAIKGRHPQDASAADDWVAEPRTFLPYHR